MFADVPDDFRSGFACFVGRPNAGKSTLTNALIGQKVAITSSRPQTTRHAIRGILHRPDAQLIVIDTPGLHKPRTLLGSRLNDIVRETWAEVDVIGFCVPADQPVGRGDEFIVSELRSVAGRTPILGVVTKTDLARPEQVAERLTQLSGLMEFADVVPVLRRRRLPGRAAGGPARRSPPRGPAAVPGRRADRRAGGDPRRGAGPRGRAGGRARRAAALDRRGRSGDAPARGPRRHDRRARDRLRGAVEPEGHRHRAPRRAAARGRARRRGARSRRCWARRCTWTCT